MELVVATLPGGVRATADRLTRLFNEHLDLVWRTARRFGLSAAEADDAAQRVFVIASEKVAEIAVDRERSFLVSAAINVARTMVRSRARKREDLMEEPDATDANPNPEQHLERQRARAAVHRILEAMQEDVRIAFVLFELEEMTMSVRDQTPDDRRNGAGDRGDHVAERSRMGGRRVMHARAGSRVLRRHYHR